MDRSNTIDLIAISQTQDSNLAWVDTEESRTVYCNIQSVTQSEFFEAQRNDMRAVYKVTMFYADYEGEQIAELDGVRYSIYRTYRKRNDELELYLQETNGATYGD